MSINSIVANPIILTELKNAIGGGGSGITSLQNTDGNIAVSVAGGVGNVDLEQNITVDQNLNVKGKIQLNGVSGNTGQVLVAQGSANPIWQNPPIMQFHVNQQTTPDTDNTQIAFPYVTFNNLTVNGTYYVLFCGTFNNRGTSTPTAPNTLVSYSALLDPNIQLQISNTQIYNVSTLNKVSFSFVCSFTATAISNQIGAFVYITGNPQINTISTDTNDYCNVLLFGVQ